MAENPAPDGELDAILSDLENILSKVEPAPPAKPPAAAAPPVKPPTAAAPPVKPPAAVAPPANPPVAAAPPSAPPSPAPDRKVPPPDLKVELASREGTFAPAPKKESAPAAPKPAPPPPRPPREVALPPAAAPATPMPFKPAPIKAFVSGGESGVPEGAAKEQIRRVAILYTAAHSAQRDAFLSFLDQSALTISKKPIYLRKVVMEQVSTTTDCAILLTKIKGLSAVAAIGVLDALGETKLRELEGTLSAGGIFFRNVAVDEIQKRSVAVDLVVDMLLLDSEA